MGILNSLNSLILTQNLWASAICFSPYNNSWTAELYFRCFSHRQRV